MTAAVAELQNAIEAKRATASTDAGRALLLADLLELSLAVHAAHGDRPCPVCGGGALDDTWRARTEEEVNRLRKEATTAERAQQALEKARLGARRLLVAPPETLNRSDRVDVRIGRGEPHANVETVLANSRTMLQKLALAFFDDAGGAGDVMSRVNHRSRADADAVGWANRGPHEEDATGVQQCEMHVEATARVTQWVRHLHWHHDLT